VMRVVLPYEPLTEGPTALRAWRDSDLAAIVAACQDPAIGRWTRVPSPYGDADGRAYLLQRYESILEGTSAPFAIVDPSSDRVLGSIAVMRIAWEHARGEVGYWLAPEARGQGHATRALRLICAFAFVALGLERLELLAATANLASQRVAERSGFRREAELRSHTLNRGERYDMVAYALLVDEAGG
jgi:RimJ/RimL family protein N-acetyltransferase